METEQISKAMTVWMEEFNTKSKHTKEVYLLYFNNFLKRWEISDAEQLFELRRDSVLSLDPRDKRQVERMVKTFMAEMLEKGYAAGSCRQVSKAVGSFLESQGFDLKLKAKDKPKGAYNGQRLALIKHIQIMWDYAPTETKQKTRAQLMFLKDSGIRISDLASLNLEDYVEARTINEDGDTFKVFWPKETEKTSEIAHIHVGPETVQAVEEYLKVRENWNPRPGEANGPEPLFLNRFGTRFNASSIGMVFRRMGMRISRKLSAHSLRKFHKTSLEGAGMAEQWIKKLQGKAADVYSKPEESGKLTEAYVKMYNALRVHEIGEVRALKEQIAQIESAKDETIKTLEFRVMVLEELLERASADTEKVSELEKKIEVMMPAFNLLQRMLDKEKGLDKLIEASKDP